MQTFTHSFTTGLINARVETLYNNTTQGGLVLKIPLKQNFGASQDCHIVNTYWSPVLQCKPFCKHSVHTVYSIDIYVRFLFSVKNMLTLPQYSSSSSAMAGRYGVSFGGVCRGRFSQEMLSKNAWALKGLQPPIFSQPRRLSGSEHWRSKTFRSERQMHQGGLFKKIKNKKYKTKQKTHQQLLHQILSFGKEFLRKFILQFHYLLEYQVFVPSQRQGQKKIAPSSGTDTRA